MLSEIRLGFLKDWGIQLYRNVQEVMGVGFDAQHSLDWRSGVSTV